MGIDKERMRRERRQMTETVYYERQAHLNLYIYSTT